MQPLTRTLTDCQVFMSDSNELTKIDLFDEVELSANSEYKPLQISKRSLSPPKEATISCSITHIDTDLINKLFGMPQDNSEEFECKVKVPIGFIQRRKHKKKRINKKWLKRYGLKPIYKILDGRGRQISKEKGIIDIEGEFM